MITIPPIPEVEALAFGDLIEGLPRESDAHQRGYKSLTHPFDLKDAEERIIYALASSTLDRLNVTNRHIAIAVRVGEDTDRKVELWRHKSTLLHSDDHRTRTYAG